MPAVTVDGLRKTYGEVAAVMGAIVSDVFSVGGPEWMRTVGSVLPLKHLQNGLSDVLAGTAAAGTWGHVAVLTAWALVAGALALRLFRWQARE